MRIDEILFAIQNSALAHLVSKSNHLVGAALQIVHVFGFILLLAAIVFISLRVLNLALGSYSLQELTRNANRLIWVGLTLAVTSGVLMFIATPQLYVSKWAFNLKIVLFIVAVSLQVTLFRKAANAELPNPTFAKASVIVSLIVWFSVSFAGRIIGFI